MKLALFATSESEPSCPTTLDAAKNDATKFSQVQAASDVTSASSSASNLTTTFYFTNGLHELGTPFNSEGSTAIKVAEPASVGGGCWDTADEVSVKVAACNLGKPQTFYVSFFPCKPLRLPIVWLHYVELTSDYIRFLSQAIKRPSSFSLPPSTPSVVRTQLVMPSS